MNANENKYRTAPHLLNAFCFPNSETSYRKCLDAAFSLHGLTIDSVEYQSFGIWTWVLTTTGELWLHDKSHGGGGYFIRQSETS